jgi:hypothetical protein
MFFSFKKNKNKYKWNLEIYTIFEKEKYAFIIQ